MPTLKDNLPLVLAMNTIVLGIVTAYIAWQQWRTNTLKVKMELYERRMKLYVALMEFIGKVLGTGNAEWAASFDFVQKTRESDFLFDDKITRYFEMVYKNGATLGAYQKALSDPHQTEENKKELPKKIDDLQQWFIEEAKQPQKRFKKFLRLN